MLGPLLIQHKALQGVSGSRIINEWKVYNWYSQ